MAFKALKAKLALRRFKRKVALGNILSLNGAIVPALYRVDYMDSENIGLTILYGPVFAMMLAHSGFLDWASASEMFTFYVASESDIAAKQIEQELAEACR